MFADIIIKRKGHDFKNDIGRVLYQDEILVDT